MAIVVESTTELADAGNSENIVLNKPAGTVEGDLLYVVIAEDTPTATMQDLQGFTLIEQGQQGQLTLFHAYKVAGASEPSSYTFVSDIGQETAARMVRLSGVDTSSPIDVSSSVTAHSGTDSQATAPSVNTTVADALLIHSASINVEVVNSVPDTEIGSVVNAEGGVNSQNISLGMSHRTQASAGASGGATFGFTGVNNGAVVSVAFTPDDGGGEPAVVTTAGAAGCCGSVGDIAGGC